MFFNFISSQDFQNIKKILDIGVGTGFVIEFLLKKYPNAFYHLNDISEKMLKIASSKFQNSNFSLIYDYIEKVELENDYNLIISNFSLQWIQDLKNFLKKIIENKKTKYFAFTTLVDNNFQEIKNIFQKYEIETLNYLSSKELNDFLKLQNIVNFSSYKKTYNLHFENFVEYAKYIKNIGANFIQNGSEKLKYIIQNENSPININYEVYSCCIKIF